MQSRASWGARQTRPPRDNTPKRVMVVHHTVSSGFGMDTLSEQRAHMRWLQNFHMDSNGWNDLGYLAVVFQPFGRLRRSRAFVGRGWDQSTRAIQRAIPAANPPNSGSIPVCLVGNFMNDKLRAGTRRRLIQIAKNVKAEFGVTHLCGHRNINATSCPGDNAYAQLDEIAAAAGLRYGDPRTLSEVRKSDPPDPEYHAGPEEVGCYEGLC